jgi:chromosome segregation ATPase
MRSQEKEPLPSIGNIVPDRDDAATYHRQKQNRPKAKEETADESGGGGGVLVYVLGALILALGGFAGFLYQQLTLAQERVGALEQRLSMTDESVNQSSVSMQVKLKELDESFAKMRDETLKGFKAQVDRQGTQLEGLDKASKSAQAALGKLGQRADEHDKGLADTRAQVEKIPPTIEQAKRKLDEHDAAFAAVNGKVKALTDTQAKHEGRLNNNDEWVESVNTFRKQMNREIVNIKQQVAGGKPPVPNEAPLP